MQRLLQIILPPRKRFLASLAHLGPAVIWPRHILGD